MNVVDDVAVSARWQPSADVLAGQCVLDCAGACITVRTYTVAVVLVVDGDIDAGNGGLLSAAVLHYAPLGLPVVVDCARVTFLGVKPFRSLLALNEYFQRAGLLMVVVPGVAVRRFLRVVSAHGLHTETCVAEALHQITDSRRVLDRVILPRTI